MRLPVLILVFLIGGFVGCWANSSQHTTLEYTYSRESVETPVGVFEPLLVANWDGNGETRDVSIYGRPYELLFILDVKQPTPEASYIVTDIVLTGKNTKGIHRYPDREVTIEVKDNSETTYYGESWELFPDYEDLKVVGNLNATVAGETFLIPFEINIEIRKKSKTQNKFLWALPSV